MYQLEFSVTLSHWMDELLLLAVQGIFQRALGQQD